MRVSATPAELRVIFRGTGQQRHPMCASIQRISECSHNARNARGRLHPLRVSPTATIFLGSIAAAMRPIRPTTARAIIASP
jgi:hypothetical protein